MANIEYIPKSILDCTPPFTQTLGTINLTKPVTMFTEDALQRTTVESVQCKASHSSSTRLPLSQQQMDIVKLTAPVLAIRGVEIATHFYSRLIESLPELNSIFNVSNQATGAQPTALAHAVLAYAANIDNLGALKAAVSRIGDKHASLGVTPEQYPIVGAQLLASIKEVLGDAVDGPTLDAWKAAYEQLADVFIGFEKNLYDESAAKPGGWKGWRQFSVARKVQESDEITSFYLVPSDKMPLPAFQPGQFVTVRCFIPELGVYQPRQYSLSDNPNKDHFRISVKKEPAAGERPAGRISNVLHESTPEGSLLDLSMPFGDFTLDINANTPVVLVSGGVGLTPMMSMLKTIVEQGKSRPVFFIHAVRNRRAHAMNKDLADILSRNSHVRRMVFYEEVHEGDVQGVDYDAVGRISVENIQDKLLLPAADADYYMCGPAPFMDAQRRGLEGLGLASDRIHSELFGVS